MCSCRSIEKWSYWFLPLLLKWLRVTMKVMMLSWWIMPLVFQDVSFTDEVFGVSWCIHVVTGALGWQSVFYQSFHLVFRPLGIHSVSYLPQCSSGKKGRSEMSRACRQVAIWEIHINWSYEGHCPVRGTPQEHRFIPCDYGTNSHTCEKYSSNPIITFLLQ